MTNYVPKILVVDDEPMITDLLCDVLQRKRYTVETSESGQIALEKIKARAFDLLITDLYLPDFTGIELLKTAKAVAPELGVILITAHSSVETAVEAMRIGAFDYLTKDLNLNEIELTVTRFLEYQDLLRENRLLRSELGQRYGIENVIGRSPEMQRVFETVEMVAPTTATVLIQGPSGTGKEVIAKAIHHCSDRRDRPFVKTNCAAIPEGLIESELFGHEKGAFTGAVRSRKGRFETANCGTLLLDEISEIKPSLQAKLLRVLQEREFERVGSPEPIKVDVRIIATTNRDLRAEVEAGRFREDLFYRLNVVPITLPPLSERKEDIPLLVDFFVEKYAAENKRDIKGISRDALEFLMAHEWPGNVRELENTIERAVVLCRGGLIHRKHLFLGQNENSSQPNGPTIYVPSGMTLKEIERHVILKTLKEKRGNRTWTAEALGISVRTLRNKLREYRQQPD